MTRRCLVDGVLGEGEKDVWGLVWGKGSLRDDDEWWLFSLVDF